MIKFNVITLFPELIKEHLRYLPFKKGLEKELLQVNVVDLRNYALDSYGSVDDKPYGGGVGMILRVEPIYNALNDLGLVKNGKLGARRVQNHKIVLLSPKGETYSQKKAEAYSQLQELTLICGRYEGIDARVKNFVDEVVSIGNYILSGGELAALAIMESSTRLLPGILEKSQAVVSESFTNDRLEHPQYTRPEDFHGLKVPDILLSGDHKKISQWRERNSKKIKE